MRQPRLHSPDRVLGNAVSQPPSDPPAQSPHENYMYPGLFPTNDHAGPFLPSTGLL